MTKRIVTVNVEDEKLTKTVSSKKKVVKETAGQKEIEKYGIESINNAQAKSKLKSKTDKGFEKNIIGEKKSVHKNLNKVDDYFDFDLRKGAKAKVISENHETVTHKAEFDLTEPKAAAERAKVYDEEVERIINIARAGALFDCVVK
ncbi:MAG: hypothetical protein IJ538_03890 [Clostridia bacterium]|nr:hypothetical protein [Clostridia bacterium]